MNTRISIFIIILFALTANEIFAQNCGHTSESWQHELANVKTPPANAANRSLNTNDIHYIPIKIHFVRHTDGSYSNHTSVEPFYQSLMMTNKILSEIKVQFYVSGDIDYLDNDAYLNCVRGSAIHTELLTHKDPTTTNVWIVDGWAGGTASGWGGPSGVELADISVLTVPHEFGHFLSLAHTFDTGNGIELVDHSNCATAGDLVCDTEADPHGLTVGQYNGEALAHSNCSMSSNTMDTQNELYHPPFANLMSYYGGFCGFLFTQGQHTKMVAGYNQYHTGYTEMTGAGISAAPINVTITPNSGYDLISWTNSAGAVATTIELSTDGGASWNVEDGIVASETSMYISNVTIGTAYKVRLRHFNSLAYSTELDYTPTNSYPYQPIPHYREADAISSIGGVTLGNTAINNNTNMNENYSLSTYTTAPELIIGGTNTLQLKIKTAAGGSGGNTFFAVWIDENRDGDFDDANELKYASPDQTLQWTIDTSITISSTASEGFSRMRVRSFNQSSTEDAYGMYSYSETEDYVIKIIPEEIPYNLTATYNTGTSQIDLSWEDNTSAYNYAIERSADGVNFTIINSTGSPTPTTYSDAMVLPYQQYEYRVKHTNGASYSNSAIVNTGNATANFCPPLSGSPCGNGYGVTEFGIASISFTNNSDGSCGITSAGYSDYYSTQNINLVGGTDYNFTALNSAFGGIKYLNIYFDANQDGIFTLSELIFSSDGITDVSSGAFTIPADAINGESRIRLRAYFNPIADACAQASYGETEDYKVTISGGSEASVINANITNVAESEMTLNWQLAGAATLTGITINQSSDGVSFTHLVDLPANNITYNAQSLTAGTRYYYQIIANGTINSTPELIWATTNGSSDAVEARIKDSFSIFPNPASTFIVIKRGAEGENIEVLDISGKVIKQFKIQNSEFKIETDDLQNGLYFVRLGNSVQKLIIE